MTDKEWQDRYQITSLRGVIWTKAEVRKRAIDVAIGLLLRSQPRDVIRAEVDLVLDDDAFMRPRAGMVPARVVEDVAFAAFHKLGISAPRKDTP